MTKPGKIAKRKNNQSGYLDDIFEVFRKEVERTVKPWQTESHFPSLFYGETRVPLYDLADRGDRYELQIEVPGIEKEKIDIKATKIDARMNNGILLVKLPKKHHGKSKEGTTKIEVK